MASLLKLQFWNIPFKVHKILISASNPIFFQKREIKKHWNPKWRHLRFKKWIKVDLIDFDEKRKEMESPPEKQRTLMKEKGIVPPRFWNEKPMTLACTGAIFEPYVPPEGDGKISIVSQEGAKQRMTLLTKKGRNLLSVRKIRNYEEQFDLPDVAELCQQIFVETNEALMSKDEDKLHDLVTEFCYADVMLNMKLKTIRWKLIKSLEPARIVQVRDTFMITKDNIFAQVTLRMHTQQTLAVYDRFGRLMHGSEAIVKDVLEYVIFEKNVSNYYGKWRIHGKVIPRWIPPKDAIKKTFIRTVEVDTEQIEDPPATKEKQPVVTT